MKLYRVKKGAMVEDGGRYYAIREPGWDELVNRDDLLQFLRKSVVAGTAESSPPFAPEDLLPPIGSQEVWAAGVTYFRSRSARMEEAKSAGGGDFYDRVYLAERPELFFKATPHRVTGHNRPVHIRRDAHWNVPEPELALFITSSGKVVGYTIGNDMSSRDIEGENPLYLPQAKIYDQSCALGPGVFVTDQALGSATEIELIITRRGETAFSGQTTLASMKRDVQKLVEYLYLECSFPHGCFLLTGTGIVPPDNFTLHRGDEVRITIGPIGTLTNQVQ